MRLKRLELSGFKSFAKPVKLEFPAFISAIVGPNGSGKSNVVEAIRWVLGEQSMKGLRGKKGEDLIFNGSQTAPKLGKASVSIVLDNRKKVLPIDYEEAIITRKVFRDGVNEYLINGSQVRLKDIIELLSRIGLGASNHHIISQGESDRILNASLKERRQMIEEALGLKIYQLKKQESERKLEKTNENIRQVSALKKEIQPHMKFLKKQVEKAERAVAVKDELRKLYLSYFSEQDDYLSAESRKINFEKEKILPEFTEIKKTLPAAEENSSVIKIKNETAKLREEFAKKEFALNEIRARRNSLERELGRFEGMIEIEESRALGSDEKEKSIPASEVEKFIEAVEKQIKKGLAEDATAGMREIFSEIENYIKKFLSEISSSGKILRVSRLPELKEKKNSILSLLEKAGAREKEITGELVLLKNRIEEKKQEASVLEKGAYEARARFNELKAILDNLESNESKLRALKDEFEREKEEAAALAGKEAVNFPKKSGGEETTYEERENMRRQIERLKIRLEDSGAVGEEVFQEYEDVKNRDEFFEKEISDLEKAAESLASLMKELEQKIDNDFKNGIEKINTEFNKFFVSMFGGGKAELKVIADKPKRKYLIGDDNEFTQDIGIEIEEEGVDVSVNLPKKRIHSLGMLSGGERALTSIALLFAVSQVNPPPFLVLDETDAALDESNSRKYAEMLKKLGERAQLIVITHNRETMGSADILYGVTMGSDSVSKLLSIKFTEAEKYMK